MKKMITTSNTRIDLSKGRNVREVVKDDPIHGTRTVLESTKKLTTIQTGKVRPRTKLDGKSKERKYGPLTTTVLHMFKDTKKGKKDRDKYLEDSLEKKEVEKERPPVLEKRGSEK